MRLLLCTDGSRHGQAAVRFGALLARVSSLPATLLGVIERADDRRRLESALDEARQWLAGAPEPQVKVRRGHPAEEILDEAASGAHDLVVVGARGRRGVTRFLLGSTAERIASHSLLPVLIVRGPRATANQLLVCTAAGEPGLAAIELGGRVAALLGAQVTVLHVMSQVPASYVSTRALADLEGRAEELMEHGSREGLHLKQALDLLAALDVPARARVRHGLVVDEILEEARVEQYDLVVIGTHTASGWMRFFLEDVTHQLISAMDRPLLVAKATGSRS